MKKFLILIISGLLLVGCSKKEEQTGSQLGGIDTTISEDDTFFEEQPLHNTQAIDISGKKYDSFTLNNFGLILYVPHGFSIDSSNPSFLHFNNFSDKKMSSFDITFTSAPNTSINPSVLKFFNDNIAQVMNSSFTYKTLNGEYSPLSWPLNNTEELITGSESAFLDVSAQKDLNGYYLFTETDDTTSAPGRYIETNNLIANETIGDMTAFSDLKELNFKYVSMAFLHNNMEYVLTISSNESQFELAQDVALDIVSNITYLENDDIDKNFNVESSDTKEIKDITVNTPDNWDLVSSKANSFYYKDINQESSSFGYGYGFVYPDDDSAYLASAYVYDVLRAISTESNEKILQYALDGISSSEYPGNEYPTYLVEKGAGIISDYPDAVFSLPMYMTFRFEYSPDQKTILYFVTSPTLDLEASESLLNEISRVD